MSEQSEALAVTAALRARILYRPSRDSTQTLLVCDDAARCLEKQHAEVERLREALVRFGKHGADCDAYRGCKCGLDDALQQEDV